MKKLILMVAFVAGPILYAQQKPTPDNDLKKIEILKTEQNKTTRAKALNLSDTKAMKNKKSSIKITDSKARTVKKVRNAESLKDKDKMER